MVVLADADNEQLKKHRTSFVTGAVGFVGKSLLWRLPKHTVAGLAIFLTSRERDAALEATLEVFGYGSL